MGMAIRPEAGSKIALSEATPVSEFGERYFQEIVCRQFKLALHIILLTLVQKSELLNARWAHVDFESKEWTIPAGHSKTGKPHTVSLARQTAELLRELKNLAGEFIGRG